MNKIRKLFRALIINSNRHGAGWILGRRSSSYELCRFTSETDPVIGHIYNNMLPTELWSSLVMTQLNSRTLTDISVPRQFSESIVWVDSGRMSLVAYVIYFKGCITYIMCIYSFLHFPTDCCCHITILTRFMSINNIIYRI